MPDKPLPFFERNSDIGPEIVEGVIREGELCVIGGAFGIGKSPAVADLSTHILYGHKWCRRVVVQRPVIYFDFETQGPRYKANIRRLAERLGKLPPIVPDELDVYLQHDSPKDEPTTKALLEATTTVARLALVEEALKQKPNALVVFDPIQVMFRFDTLKGLEIQDLYRSLRFLMSRFPRSAMMSTFNLRKQDRKHGKADLLSDPRSWLEEISGSLDIMNRSDVRLGFELRADDEARIINGVRRGEESMSPLFIRPVYYKDLPTGFELCPPDDHDLLSVLTDKQQKHWQKLPEKYRFEDIADVIVPRASLSRIIKVMMSLGFLRKDEHDNWHKVRPGVEL